MKKFLPQLGKNYQVDHQNRMIVIWPFQHLKEAEVNVFIDDDSNLHIKTPYDEHGFDVEKISKGHIKIIYK
jgi:hypothetical protein